MPNLGGLVELIAKICESFYKKEKAFPLTVLQWLQHRSFSSAFTSNQASCNLVTASLKRWLQEKMANFSDVFDDFRTRRRSDARTSRRLDIRTLGRSEGPGVRTFGRLPSTFFNFAAAAARAPPLPSTITPSWSPIPRCHAWAGVPRGPAPRQPQIAKNERKKIERIFLTELLLTSITFHLPSTVQAWAPT